MARGRKPPETSGPMPVPAWMLTYADSMSLLLTFFVLMLTFSTTNDDDFQTVTGGLIGALGGLPGGTLDNAPSIVEERIADDGRASARGPEGPPELGPVTRKLMSIHDRIKEGFEGTAVNVAIGRKGFVIRLPSDRVFDGPTAMLSESGRREIAAVASVIGYLPNDIEIAAHTDGSLPGGPGGTADIELSLARATTIARFFENFSTMGDPAGRITLERIAIIASGGLDPFERKNSAAARGRNRRLDITLLRHAR